jgi:hypothetical protein
LRDALEPDGKSAPPRFVAGGLAEIVQPTAVVDMSGRLDVFWTQLDDGRAQIAFARESEPRGTFAPPTLLTSGPQPNAAPRAALHSDGRVYVAWESELAVAADQRAHRDVLLAPLGDDGRLGAAVHVGDGRYADTDASLLSSSGKLWIAWTAWTGRDYEVRLRSFDPKTAALGATIEVSADPVGDDVHPTLAAAPSGDVWVAWDRVQVGHRGRIGGRLQIVRSPTLSEVTTCCVCIRDGKRCAPRGTGGAAADGVVPGAPRMSASGGLARVAFDRAGRLWSAGHFLRHDGARMLVTFPLRVQCLTAEGWSAPIEITGSGGLPEPPALLPFGDGVLVAGCCDGRGTKDYDESPPPELAATLAKEQVVAGCWYGATAIGLAVARNASTSAASDLVEVPAPDPPRRSDSSAPVPLVRDEIRRGDDHWQLFWGDLHRHSCVSRCMEGKEPSPADRWTQGRDEFGCDFMALTDHCGHMEPFAWWQLDKQLWLHASDRFCPLAAFEWSTVRWGHHNVILADRLTPLVQASVPLEQLYRDLPVESSITIPHHSAHPDYAVPFDELDDAHTRLIEVYQAMRGSFEFDGCFGQAPTATVLGCFARDALLQGHEYGIIASTDHGFGASYACVLAKSLDRASLFEAMKARRTYGATTKGIFLDFRIGDAVMGESIELSDAPRMHVKVRGTDDLAEVAVIKDGRTLKTMATRSTTPNHLAPLRLVAKLASDRPDAAPARDWSITVRGPRTKFVALVDARRATTSAPLPAWTAAEGSATFTWPAGYSPAAGVTQFPIHVTAPEDAVLEVASEAMQAEMGFAKWRKEPLEIAGEGVRLELQVLAGDANLAVDEGLGTDEIERDWRDDSPPQDASWYYLRVIQTNGEMAWSSPIFVKRRTR